MTRILHTKRFKGMSERMCRRLHRSPGILGSLQTLRFKPGSNTTCLFKHIWKVPEGQVLDALAQLAPLSGLPKACQADKPLVHDVPENADKGRLAHRRFFLHGAKLWPAG